jgi:DNA-binding GntR family transcriptional regulator
MMELNSNVIPTLSPGARTNTLTEQVYRQIKRAILTCILKPGQIVYEIDMIQQYGVSKTPVREALKLLTQERLIQSIPGTCYLVTQITVKDINEIWEMRSILEEITAKRAASQATVLQLKKLESKTGEIFQIHNFEDLIRWYDQNREFHLAMAEITENSRLVAALCSILNEVNRLLLLDPEMPFDTSVWVHKHQSIMKALKKRDGDLATSVTLEDMQASRPRIQGVIFTSNK